MRALISLVLVTAGLASAAPPTPEQLPASLRDWSSWVLHDERSATSPFLHNSEARVCAWPARLALTLGFEVIVPFGGSGGAAGCDRAADKLRDALAALPEGLHALEMDCGEVSADEVLGAYRCRCAAKWLAFLVAETDGGEPEFADFKLKGTVNNGNQ